MAKLSYDMALPALICVTIREEGNWHAIDGFQPKAGSRDANRHEGRLH